MPELEKIIKIVVEKFKNLPFVYAIVLGGSRATGTATEMSDVDIGLYYDSNIIDYRVLNTIAHQIDDDHRENLICREGEWGKWVNCGGWLKINGYPVDLILRDWRRVKKVIDDTDQGKYACHYHVGHPHAYVDVMYRGELAVSRVLYAKNQEFWEIKQHAQRYPNALKKSIIYSFLSEASFTCMQVEKNAERGDIYYLEGQVFRAISAMNQVLFALNGEWLLNEKKAVFRVMNLSRHPAEYARRVGKVFAAINDTPISSAQELKALYGEVSALCLKRSM